MSSFIPTVLLLVVSAVAFLGAAACVFLARLPRWAASVLLTLCAIVPILGIVVLACMAESGDSGSIIDVATPLAVCCAVFVVVIVVLLMVAALRERKRR